MSKKFNMIKSAYERGTWNNVMVHNAVVKGWITEEEYQIITGEEYA